MKITAVIAESRKLFFKIGNYFFKNCVNTQDNMLKNN
jgi:hypothetical protein